MSADTPSDADIDQELIAHTLGRVRTCLPAWFVSYDSAKQTATVQIAVRHLEQNVESGVMQSVLPPPIPNVPVAWLSTAAGSITVPVAAGDWCTLLVYERSTDEWRSTGAQDNSPRDDRRFDLTDCVAFPGARPFTAPLPSSALDPAAMVIAANAIKMGSSTATDWMALAVGTLARLNALESTFNSHTHLYAQGLGSIIPTPPPGIPATTSTLADIKSAKVQSE